MSFPLQPISALGNITTGSTPPTSERKYWDGDIPFVTPSELDQIIPVFTTPRTLSQKGSELSRMLREGAVMVSCIGSLGKVGIAGRPMSTNQQINSIEFDEQKIWPKFGFYACQLLKSKLVLMAPATTIPIVNKSKFEQLELPVPPLSEQRRIAAILDKAVALNSKRSEALLQLDRLALAIFVEMFGDPATNPREWPIRTLKELGKVSTGGTPPSSSDGMFGGDIPFVTPGDLESDLPARRTVTTAGATVAGTVRAGATLVCCIGTIGKMGIASNRTSFNQQLNAVEWFGGAVDDIYGFVALRFFKPTIIAWGSSTTLPILRKSIFEKIAIPVPPLEMQREFSRRVRALELLKEKQRQGLGVLSSLFASIQYRAFRGEL